MYAKRVFSVCLTAALVMTTLATAAHGELLIGEGFDYGLTSWDWSGDYTAPVTSTGLNGGTGFAASSEWGIALQSGTTGTVSVVGGITFGTLETSGNALFTQNLSNSALASRAIGVTVPVGDTVWTSYLWSYTSEGGSTATSYSQLTDSQFGATNRRLRILPNQYGSSTTSSMSDGSATLDFTRPSLQSGDTYLMVGKNSNIGQSGSGTLWALSESGFALSAADGIVTEQELNDNSVGTVTGALSINTITSGAYLQLANVWGAGTFDEFRVGTTLADITPTSSIPEPGTIVILVTGLIGLVCYAWRKWK